MARTLNQVLADVSKQSDPQRQAVLKQISDIPALQQADEAGLNAQKDQGFNDITASARRRGVAYWGIPIAEQQSYLSNTYLPALAKMKQGYNDRRTSLDMALADIGKNDYDRAYNIFNIDRSFAEQQRQYNQGYKLQQQQLAIKKRQAAAAEQANASSYLQAQNAAKTSERENALKAEIERLTLLSLQDSRGAVSGNDLRKLGWQVPNF